MDLKKLKQNKKEQTIKKRKTNVHEKTRLMVFPLMLPDGNN